jgi:hypothetical protein
MEFKYVPDDGGMDAFNRSPEKEDEAPTLVSIFEAADVDVEKMSKQQLRTQGMSIALVWVDDKDATFDTLAALAVGMADADGDKEIGEDEEEHYNDLLAEIGGALIALGGAEDNVHDFLENESTEAGKKLVAHLAKKLDGVETDDDTLITRYAAKGQDMILEAYKKVIRNGKVTFKRKRVKKFKMNAGQKAAMKKARKKSNTASAKRNRKKSMRLRKKSGLK